MADLPVSAALAASSFRLQPGAFDAAIIDLDGTMVDTVGDFVAAINLMLADIRASASRASMVDAASVQFMVGKGSEHLIKSVLNHVITQAKPAQDAIYSVALYPLAFARYQHHYSTINGQYLALYPGVLEGLMGLAATGLKLACVTNKPVVFAKQLLQHKGVDKFFTEVFGGDSFARRKPDPLPLLKTCEALGFLPARTLMIGDSSNDAQAARAAGCPVLLVSYGYNHGQPLREVDADGVIDSLTDLQWLR